MSLYFYTVPYYTSAAPEYILAQEMQQITTFETKPRQRERKIIYIKPEAVQRGKNPQNCEIIWL